MAKFDYVIIGGGVAGTTAAETLRERDKDATIALLGEEQHPLYSRVMIPSYLKNKIHRDSLFLRKISDYESRRIDFFPNTTAVEINTDRNEVYADQDMIFSYKKLLIASGGKPKATSNKSQTPRILKMHTIEDADEIKKAMMEETAQKEALVMGDGFIALEFIETFLLNGFRTHAMCRKNYFGEEKFGKDGGMFFEENFKKHGIILHKNTEVAFMQNGGMIIKSTDKISAVLAGVGIGIERNTANFPQFEKNVGIVTNEFLETSNENVYAAGDIAEFFDVYAGTRRVVGNWTNSFLQGRIAALNMFTSNQNGVGERTIFKSVPAYNIVNLGFNLTLAGYLEDADDFWERAEYPNFMRIFLKGGRVRGGVLINRFNDKIKLAKLIASNSEVSKNELEKIF